MPKVKVVWSIELIETYEADLDFEDFAAMFDGEPPTPEQVMSGQVDTSDIDAEQLADLEEERNVQSAGVSERYIDGFTVLPVEA